MLFKHYYRYKIGIRHISLIAIKYRCKEVMELRIKEVSERFNITTATLRYYEKMGLFEDVSRINGIREYEDKDIERLSLIITLKNTGLSIEAIAKFIELDKDGANTINQRIKMLKNERQKILDDIHEQQNNLYSLDCLIYQIKGNCQ